APTSEPTNAPTIPPQKRAGKKIVKCQIASPIITQPSMPISETSLESAVPLGGRCHARSSRPPVAFVAGAPALFARLCLFLEHQVLRGEVRRRIAPGRALGRPVRAIATWRPAAARRRGALGDDARATALAGLRSVDVQVFDQFLELVARDLLARFRGRGD